MPCDYSKYPANWHSEIVPSILARAGEVRDEAGRIIIEARCEKCGVENHSTKKNRKFFNEKTLHSQSKSPNARLTARTA